MRSPWGSDRGAGWGRVRGDGLSTESGTVTAEFATVLPAVILVLACCLGAVSVVGQQVRLTDASADAARALARGDDVGRVAALVRHAVPGARFGTDRRGDFICVRAHAPSGVDLFDAFGLSVESRSCALAGGL